MSTFSMTIISPYTHEELLVEGHLDNEIWFDIQQEEGIDKLRIAFFLPEGHKNWKLTLDGIYLHTTNAAKHLLQMETLPERKQGLGNFIIRKEKENIQILNGSALWVEIPPSGIVIFHHYPIEEKWWTFSLDEMWNAFDEAKKLLPS